MTMIATAAKWVAGRILRVVPESVVGRVLPGGFRFSPGDRPASPVTPATATRLYIAPVNYAGQAWQWARAVERHLPDTGAVNMVVRTAGDFRHPADQVVPLGVYAASRSWQRAQRAAVLGGFTHVLIEAERQPFGAVLDESVLRQVRDIRAAGLTVLMVCHGSDIRSPGRHAVREADSPFRDAMAALAPRLERIARRNRRILDRVAAPVFVTTPDLLLDVPEAHWLPLIVDPAQWRTETVPLQRERPVVVHAPSSGPVKGSDLIDPVLERLDAEGVIEYRRVRGVPFEEMAIVYGEADVVVDQIRLGDYGGAALEAMAAGRVVIAHVSDHARSVIREATGAEVPVVEATADTLDDVVRGIVADRDGSRAIAAAGRAFAAEFHDGRRTAAVLAPYLGRRP
jgi:hypothetical protein